MASFNDTLSSATKNVSNLKRQMDASFKNDMQALANALFALVPELKTIHWNQYIPNSGGVGFMLGTIEYSFEAPGQILAKGRKNTRRFAQGTTSIDKWAAMDSFTNFLGSIPYHLFCRFGANAFVMITRDGITTTNPRW